MEVAITDKVGEIVAEDIRTADIFKKHHIDFCCGGGISLEKACADKGVEVSTLVQELKQVTDDVNEKLENFDAWSAAELCDYLEEKHHSYVRDKVPILAEYAQKVADVHGHHHPELKLVNEKVKLLCADLIPHLQREENILFPWIRACVEDENNVGQLPFGQFENPVRVMENDHDMAGDLIKEINALTKGYFLPDYACNTWRAYFHLLKEFEADLFMHIHLENNVLHKKARALDSK